MTWLRLEPLRPPASNPLLVHSVQVKAVGSLVFWINRTGVAVVTVGERLLHVFKTQNDGLACDQNCRLFILHAMGFLSNLVLNNECSVIGVALSKISAVDCL